MAPAVDGYVGLVLPQIKLGPARGEQLLPARLELLRARAGDDEAGAPDRVCAVACGDHHSMCLTRGGEVYSWGHAEYGQHGSGGGKDGGRGNGVDGDGSSRDGGGGAANSGHGGDRCGGGS